MGSTFGGIEIGKRSLIGHTLAMDTVGHNVSNADVEGYSRQRVEMVPFPPIYDPALNRAERAGQLGQGMIAERIERMKDMLLERRIVAEAGGQGYWDSRDKYLQMVEQVYNEPTEHSVRTLMDRFWEGWQELSVRPTEMGARQAVLQRGDTLVDAVHSRFERLKGIRDMLDDDITGTVKQVNDLSRQIAALNEQIVKVKAMGDNPNDYMDRRDLLINRLSSLIDVTVDDRDPDEYVVHTSGYHLVQGKHYEELAAVPDKNNEGYARILWAGGDREMFFRGGRLAALVEMRDGDVRDQIQKLDTMTVNFIDLVNEIHRTGFGTTRERGLDFFVERPFVDNPTGNYDSDADGAFDSTRLFRLTGAHELDPKAQIGLRGTLTLPGATEPVAVEYFPTDTVEDLIDRVNRSGAEVSVRLNREGQLTVRATTAADGAQPDFVLRGVRDDGDLLTGYAGLLAAAGEAGAYDWRQPEQTGQLAAGAAYAVAPVAHPSGWITINPAITRDPGRVATSFDETLGGPGDGAAALAIARLRTERVLGGDVATFDDFFAAAVADIGLRGEQADTALRTQELVMKELNDMKSSVSGVNMDEEMANMVKIQHGFNAAARFIAQIDTMLDTVINRMGV
jgi:flagellar hook-associated protein 1